MRAARRHPLRHRLFSRRQTISYHRQKSVRRNSMAWAEALDAALPMAPAWGWRRSRRSLGVGVACWRSAAYSGKNVHPAPSINVVWRSRIAAQGGSDMNSRVI